MRLPIVVFQDENTLKIEVGSESSSFVYTVEASKHPNEVKCNCMGFQTHKRCKHIKYCKSMINSFFMETSTKEVNVEGWKGESGLLVKKEIDTFKIIEHRKSKSTGEIEESIHFIPFENVKGMWEIIKGLIPKYVDGVKDDSKFKLKYKIMAYAIIEKYGFPADRNSFNGGVNRAKYYFPFYYYPVKILEWYGVIVYSGRGIVTRLSDTWEV